MLVKFEHEEKKKVPQPILDLDIDNLSKQAGRHEAEMMEEKYTPTEEELENIQKVLDEMMKNQSKNSPADQETTEDEPKINRLTYTRS